MEMHRFLDEVGFVLDKRFKEYGDALNSFKKISKRWSLTLDQDITPAQVVLLMMDLKMSRLKENNESFDSLIDIVGYAACFAEMKDFSEDDDSFYKSDLKFLCKAS